MVGLLSRLGLGTWETWMADSLLPITNYQMAPSKRGAGGGSATHKEPT